jgi:hypothetical protein
LLKAIEKGRWEISSGPTGLKIDSLSKDHPAPVAKDLHR